MDRSFRKSFLCDLRRDRRGERLTLALFGKHPAWDDHMDDLGLDTPSLRAFKRILYIEGMAANAARQQRLEPAEADGVTPYQHILLWIRDRELLLARLVESRDGRGRGFFPLVGAVHCRPPDSARAIGLLTGPLRRFVDDCRACPGRNELRELHRHAAAALESEFRQRAGSAAEATQPDNRELESMRRALAPGGGFHRLAAPLTRYDIAANLAALDAARQALSRDSDLAVLLAHCDAAGEIDCCIGQPERGDFWFLRHRGG
jgi:hypothetical protein